MLEIIFGVVGGILTSIRLMPQVHKSLKMKETRDLSLWFLIILFFQALLLIFYGLTKPDSFIVYMNILPLICSVILLWLKNKYK
jgi:MtN3 and saliva related transmembrane protein